MNDEEKLGFIAEKLEREQEALPVSLEKGNIVRKLQNVEVKKNKKSYVYIKRAAALAAALAVTLTAVYASGLTKRFNKSDITAADNKETESFPEENHKIPNDYSDIENYFIGKYKESLENSRNNFYYVDGDGLYNGALSSKDETVTSAATAGAPMAPETVNEAFSFNNNGEHSVTNIQVGGVDEGDMIKNDGRYLYLVTGKYSEGKTGDMSSYIPSIKIIDAAEMKVISSVPIPKGNEKTAYEVKEIYLQGSKLTTVMTSYDRISYNNCDPTVSSYNGETVYISSCCMPILRNQKTVIAVYDIENKNEPKLISKKTQDGEYESSRAVGSVLYTVSSYNVDLSSDLSENDVKENCVPTVNGERIALPSITVKGKDNDEPRNYIVITATDINNEKLSGASAAYLGYFENMYSTAETLYLTAYEYKETDSGSSSCQTKVMSFSLSRDEIKLKAEGSVPGMLDDRYSMDEHGGYLRIFTTDYSNRTFRNRSSLYILDASNLKQVGSLVDIAKNEEVKSARFMGSVAYVVTYENTDPLFVIDLSSPENPTITGQVKLPGFSEYLHPLANGLLLGVGYGGDDESADFRKLKLTLFDVTDMKKPKELSSFVVKDAYSTVNNDPKAFLSFDENTFGIPVEKYVKASSYTERAVFSLAVFEVKDNEISLKNNFTHPDEGDDQTSFFRGAFIGKTVYTVTENTVASHDMGSGEMMKTLSVW